MYIQLFIDTCLDPRFFDTSKIEVFNRVQKTQNSQTYFDSVKCTYFIRSYQYLQDLTINCGTLITLHNSGIVCTNTVVSNDDYYCDSCSYSVVSKQILESDFNENSSYALIRADKKDKTYKIMSITENSASDYSVFATEFCSTKFDLIEGDSPKDVDTDSYFYTANQSDSIVQKPPSVYFSNIEYILLNNLPAIRLTWKFNPIVTGYNLFILRPNSQRQFLLNTVTSTANITIGPNIVGQYNSITQEYSYTYILQSSETGTFQFFIETYARYYNNTVQRHSESTSKTITVMS